MMTVFLVAALAASASDRQFWVDVSPPLAPGDYITAVQYGPEKNEIWVGTWDGYILRSTDDGMTYRETFRPIDAEPLVQPRLANRRSPFINDLARGLGREYAPGDRVGRARQTEDLAGQVRNRQRERSTPLLSSLLSPSARITVEVQRFYNCHGYVYVKTGAGIWRTQDGVFWDQLPVGPTGSRERVRWLSCDSTTPGRFILNTDRGILETLNNGASFHYYGNPLPRTADAVDIAAFLGNGYLLVIQGDQLFYENEDGGYREICYVHGDSVEADEVRYMIIPSDRLVGAITGDGVLLCDVNTNSIRRFPGEIFSREPIRSASVSGRTVVVVTGTTVYWSDDGGQDFRVVFRTSTTDPIGRVSSNDADPDQMIVNGNRFIWRKTPQLPSTRVDTRQLRRVGTKLLRDAYSGRNDILKDYRRASLDVVLDTALERFELSANQLAQTRNVLRFRSLMPEVVAGLVGNDGFDRFGRRNVLDGIVAPVALNGENELQSYQWQVFFAWDLNNLIQDARQTNVFWRDLERLRFRLVERVKEAYQNFERASRKLDDPSLTEKQRMYVRIRQREAAAYLHAITGERFPDFHPESLSPVLSSAR